MLTIDEKSTDKKSISKTCLFHFLCYVQFCLLKRYAFLKKKLRITQITERKNCTHNTKKEINKF